MTALSDYVENALMNLLCKGTAFTALSTVYIGLHTAVGADEGNAAWRTTEVTGGGYARVAVSSGGWTGPTNGVLTSNADITLPAASAAWGTVTHFSVWDAASLTTANLLFKEALAASKVVASGDVFKFTSGNLTLGLL